MAHIVLFHSALGLRPAVTDFADRLRALGHTVDAPDYYDGNVFDNEKKGIAFRDAIGVPSLLSQAEQALDNAPDDAVLAGFSLGAFFSQVFASKRPNARAAILMHSAAAPRGDWNGVPVQVHRYETDNWIEPAEVAELGRAVKASGASFEDFVTPGKGHLFTDLGTPDGNEEALAATIERIHERVK